MCSWLPWFGLCLTGPLSQSSPCEVVWTVSGGGGRGILYGLRLLPALTVLPALAVTAGAKTFIESASAERIRKFH
ncbi:hypothetical protein A8926_6243 [Saccharopolyspora spinosa]|uniref:Uncharacterized protein n=1 Tax=Saccharopolyspora spinosa TaxID=60894 RepID=A0A2N3Y5H9_SACSN|nr:hypothetical protein A8926_6243 [Saccharopolyspora spinosa]